MDWKTFRRIFKDKYYPTTYYKSKRNEFLSLIHKPLLVAKYERKYTSLSQYAEPIISFEGERCQRFEKRLQKEIHTLVGQWPNGLISHS